ncbi:MAG: hypothetical protein J7L62_07690 [Candidatus Aminicenantes bacterium]|nr:hypothetical protein [Candidatus Aminicenantes bacterium]
MVLLEELWEEKIPLDVIIKSVEEGFTSVFRRRRKRMITLSSLKKRIYRENERAIERKAETGVRWEKSIKVEGEIGKLLKEGLAVLEAGNSERALEIEDKITEKLWTEASEEEREEELLWAMERVRTLKLPDEAKREIALKGAKRRLREKKKIPFIF